MDTLVIVRKIREAEALADSGKHGDARKLLEPLLTRGDLSDSHKSLVAKKIEVFNKQHERATRVLSRRASEANTQRDPNDDTDLGSGRKPALNPDRPLSSGDTTVERPALAPGAPTEAVPRLRNPADKDTTKLRKRPEPEKPRGDTTLADRDLISLYDNAPGEQQPNGITTVRDRPAAPPKPPSERRQIAARPSERSPTVKNGAMSQVDTEVPARASSNRNARVSAVDLRQPAIADLAPLPQDEALASSQVEPIPPKAALRKPTDSQALSPVRDDKFESDEMPALGEMSARPDERGMFKAPVAPDVAAPSVRVQDSYIAPTTEFSPAPPMHQKSARTSKDLTSMVERLPDDDLRKELALEVVRLREELEKAKSGRRDTDRTGSAGSSRRIVPGEKPESSMFKIPSNRVNTIVRTAAGTSDITAHMPTRDENVPELEVMRRDNMKKRPESENSPPSRVTLAQDYIENSRAREPDRLKFFATALGLLVIAGLVAWAIYWAITIVSSQQAN
jgi:hypothetical protein